MRSKTPQIPRFEQVTIQGTILSEIDDESEIEDNNPGSQPQIGANQANSGSSVARNPNKNS